MKAREKTIPKGGATRIPEALDRLIELYTATNRADEAKKWRAERAKPAKLVSLTDGRSRQLRIDNRVFFLRHAAPKDLPPGNPTSALVIQALRFLGQGAVDADTIGRLRRRLSARERRQLLQGARYTTEWIAEVARQVAADEPQEALSNG
jgi:hypothetical protein